MRTKTCRGIQTKSAELEKWLRKNGENAKMIAASVPGIMLICGLIYSYFYYLFFGINVFEFASIDFYIRAALVGYAALFFALSIALSLVFFSWLYIPGSRLTGRVTAIMVVLTIGLPIIVGVRHANWVEGVEAGKSPNDVAIRLKCENGESSDGCKEECPRRLVGVIGDRIILYDTSTRSTTALHSDDVKSIQWKESSIHAEGRWFVNDVEWIKEFTSKARRQPQRLELAPE